MYQGLRGRIKELLLCNSRPQVREDPGNEIFKNSVVASQAQREGRLRRVGSHPAPHRLWSSTFFVDQRFIACVQTPPPLSKNRFLLRGGGSAHRLTI